MRDEQMWLGGARARGRMPVVELLFPLDPAEGDVCVTCTRTLVVNRCTFLLLTLFYSMWRLAFTIYSFFICNMLSQMWINQLTPDVFIQLLHVKGNSYVNMMCLCIIFISSVSCNKSHVSLFTLFALTHILHQMWHFALRLRNWNYSVYNYF